MSALSKALQPLSRKLNNMISRAIINIVKDSEGIQIVQIGGYANEVLDGIERFGNFGFTAVPKKPDGTGTAEGIVVFPGGNRSHGIVIALEDRRFRPTDTEEGESVVYNAVGDTIKLDKDGNINITATKDVNITAFGKVDIISAGDIDLNPTGDVNIAGNLEVDGDINATGEVADNDGDMAEQRTAYNAHKHGGVTTGGGVTAGTDTPMT